MTEWDLGIDFGTTYTVAAVAQGGIVTVLDVESSGHSRLPSCVFVNPDGQILTGSSAQHQAAFNPERYEPTPKRSFGEGELFLGDGLVLITDLAAGVIGRVYTEASRQQGETTPRAVRITHPAIWSESRLGVLREAVEKAGISRYELLPEPVAAAARIGWLATQPGDIVAVYDFGGGTFDSAVLRKTDHSFEVAGPPMGRDPLGGEDIDRHIIEHLSKVLADGYEEEWSGLLNPRDTSWRRQAAQLRKEVQQAKETLSETSVCQLWIPGLEREAQLTRAELEQLIGDDVDATVDTLEEALDAAGVEAKDLAGIYMVGGSSRIPLVADTIWRRFGVQPDVQENPKSIVAMGAAGWGMLTQPGGSAAAPALAQQQPAALPSAPFPGRAFRSRLVAAIELDSWPEGCSCTSDFGLSDPTNPAMGLQAREEPAAGMTVAQYAERIGGFRAQAMPGYVDGGVQPVQVLGEAGLERRFWVAGEKGPVDMFEQYLVSEDRAIALMCPVIARVVADSLSLLPRSLGPDKWFEARFAVVLPTGWKAVERLTLQRHGTWHTVMATHSTLPPGVPAPEWHGRQIDELVKRRSEAKVFSDLGGLVLNQFTGQVVTARWYNGGIRMLARRGIATADGMGYTMTIDLPLEEQALFSSLARQVRVRPEEWVI